MEMKVYEYSKCSTCRKALKFLDKRKIVYNKFSIVENPPSVSDLKKMLSYLGGDIKKLFNTSGVLYREMGLSKKLESLSVSEALKLLSENGKLIKRPFLLTSNHGTVGFNEVEWARIFENRK